MKKKIFKLFSIFALVLFMSGCVKYNVIIKITSDKKMAMELIIATSKSLQSNTEGDTTSDTDTTTDDESTESDESLKKLEKQGWKLESYEDDNYVGSKLSKKFDNIDDYSSDKETSFDLNALVEDGEESKYIFTKKVKDGKTIYVAKFKADTNTGMTTDTDTTTDTELTEEEKTLQSQTEALTSQMLQNADLKVSIEVPSVISSNATTVDGNKLTWDLTKLNSNSDIEFEFSLDGKSNGKGNSESSEGEKKSLPIIPIAIGGGLALLFIIIIIIVIGTRNKKPKTNQVTNPVTATPNQQAPTTPSVQAPTMGTSTPVVETPAPVVETPAPVVETSTPVVETPAPVVETSTPVVETPAPVVETPAPVVETPAPVVETSTPVVEEPVIETSIPVVENSEDIKSENNM